MPKTLRQRLLAAGLVLALTGTRSGAQSCSSVPATPSCGQCQTGTCQPGLWQRWKHNLQDRMFGYPAEFQAVPLGQSVNAHMSAQIVNGIAARMMLYEYDFECASANLNLRGRDRLAQMADWLATQPFPLIVERTPRQPGLAKARRDAVLAEFVAAGYRLSPERVIIGPAPLGQMSGVEAQLLYQNLLRYTEVGWPAVPPGGGVGPSPGQGPGGTTSGANR